jgi:hypothetical protein
MSPMNLDIFKKLITMAKEAGYGEDFNKFLKEGTIEKGNVEVSKYFKNSQEEIDFLSDIWKDIPEDQYTNKPREYTPPVEGAKGFRGVAGVTGYSGVTGFSPSGFTGVAPMGWRDVRNIPPRMNIPPKPRPKPVEKPKEPEGPKPLRRAFDFD